MIKRSLTFLNDRLLQNRLVAPREVMGRTISSSVSWCFSGVLFGKAEGERKHHAEPEAGGHPEGLRQTVIAFNQPTTPPLEQPPSLQLFTCCHIDFSVRMCLPPPRRNAPTMGHF